MVHDHSQQLKLRTLTMKPVHISNLDVCLKQFWLSGEAWPVASDVYNKIIKINVKNLQRITYPGVGNGQLWVQASSEICKKRTTRTRTTVLSSHTIPFLCCSCHLNCVSQKPNSNCTFSPAPAQGPYWSSYLLNTFSVKESRVKPPQVYSIHWSISYYDIFHLFYN